MLPIVLLTGVFEGWEINIMLHHLEQLCWEYKRKEHVRLYITAYLYFFFCFSYLSGGLQREEWKLLQTWRVCVSMNDYEVLK